MANTSITDAYEICLMAGWARDTSRSCLKVNRSSDVDESVMRCPMINITELGSFPITLETSKNTASQSAIPELMPIFRNYENIGTSS